MLDLYEVWDECRQILFGNDGSPYNYMYECQDVSVVWSKDVSTHLV